MRRSTFLATLAALLSLTLAALSPAWAAPPKPMKYVKDGHKQVVKILNQDPATRDPALRALIQASIDVEDLGRRSLGKHWGELTADQQKEYQGAFRELFEVTYTRRLSDRKPETDYELEWEQESVRGDTGKVVVFVLHEDTETEVEFTLKAKGDLWLIHDVAYNGVSVEERYQSRHTKIFREQGFAGLMKHVRERTEEIRKEGGE
jgi:phospholipid transport system substrate-binding protein